MALTYIATILDPRHPGGRDTYPGISYQDDGSPVPLIRIRYTGDDETFRVSNYSLAGPGEGADHHSYSWDSDAAWDSAARDDSDWVIDLHHEDPDA